MLGFGVLNLLHFAPAAHFPCGGVPFRPDCRLPPVSARSVLLRLYARRCPMEYGGGRFTIRMGIERDKWHIAIHSGGKPLQVIIFGTREDANLKAHSMIDAWLRKRRRSRQSQS